ncbi:auswaprin-a-like [Bufo bufo]|uniref:auswaprin-a-like n=1 Tax=Bufo bufo TaxID=8384 RepID=UPI001ABE81A4|nr:auswaprin-a-like [Bufo bufo]
MAPVTGALILLILCCAGALADNHDKPPPPSEKPGGCPISPYRPCDPFPEDECKSDAECTGNKKCCYYGCNRNCRVPVKEKPGRCPPPSIVCLPVFPSVSPPKCRVDSDCTGNKKCCIITCGPECINV